MVRMVSEDEYTAVDHRNHCTHLVLARRGVEVPRWACPNPSQHHLFLDMPELAVLFHARQARCRDRCTRLDVSHANLMAHGQRVQHDHLLRFDLGAGTTFPLWDSMTLLVNRSQSVRVVQGDLRLRSRFVEGVENDRSSIHGEELLRRGQNGEAHHQLRRQSHNSSHQQLRPVRKPLLVFVQSCRSHPVSTSESRILIRCRRLFWPCILGP